MIVDLHTHTNASDGELSPDELVGSAVGRGVGLLAITDHDTISAYARLNRATGSELTLISGIEFSANWRRRTVHIVGLNFDLASSDIAEAARNQQSARVERAEKIAVRLAKRGVGDALAGALEICGDGQIGRAHFARFLTRSGVVRTDQEAFRRYLGDGKSCDAKADWLGLEQAIDTIRAAGGTAVLAHPLAYKMTRTRLGELAREFVAAGGQAIEVISGSQQPQETATLAALASACRLRASLGSDFHREEQRWRQLGRLAELPSACVPVWDSW